MLKNRVWTAAAMSVPLSAIAMPAFAQAQAPQSQASQIETIVVTAEKRAENIQRVPATVTAVTGSQLEQLHIVEPTQLTNVAPALTYSESTTPTSSGFSVRGIGTSTFSAGVEQSVSTVIDGVVYGQPQAAAGLVDVNHIEILEGPQGMLFGKNASAGLVNIVTNNPDLNSFSGFMSGTVGSSGEYRSQGIVNAPISSDAALRVVGFYNHEDGVIRDVYLPDSYERLNNEDNYGFRAKLLWQPISALTVLLSADYTRDDSACCFYTTRVDTPTPTGAAALLFPLNGIVSHYETLYGITPGPNNTEDALDTPLGATPHADRREYAGMSAQIDYTFDDYTLESITAYRANDYRLDFDADQVPIDLFDQDGGPQSYRQTSEELRLTSPTGGAFDYVVGAFYYSSQYNTLLVAGGPFLAPLGIPGTVIADVTANVGSTDYAAYAQGTYHVTDAFRLIAGGRFTHDDLSLYYWNRSDPNSQLPLAFFGQAPAQFTQTTSASNFSWKLGAQYDLTSDIMGYFTVSRGYKGPGFSALPGALPTQNQAVRPEIPMNYEVGVKSELFDHHLVLNGTAFIEDFKDFQAQVYDSNTVPPAFRVTNAGEMKSKGLEMQAIGRPMDGLTVSANAAYIYAYYASLKNISCYFAQTYPTVVAPCANVGGNLVDDASGNRLANSPRWSWNSTFDYQWPIWNGGYVAEIETDYNWRSSNQFSANGDPNTIQGAYGLWNASVAWSPADQGWQVRAYVHNLLDTHYATFILPDAGDSKGGYAQFINPDEFRHVGVMFDVKF